MDTDFLDHWKTGMVVDELQDKCAPLYILRLWAHCQERKSDCFAMPSRGLKAQCKYEGDHEKFEAALVAAGFIERDGETIKVIGWAEKNASLIAAWENGGKGGRPKKEPTGNPAKTHGLATGNPAVTQGQPSANPTLTQTKPIREDKSREEDSVSKDTGDKSPMSPEEIIFTYGVPLLTNAGTPDKQARSFLGGLRKAHGDEALVNSLRECLKAKPLQPLEWLAAALPPTSSAKAPQKAGKHAGFTNFDYREGVSSDGTFA